VDEEVRDRAVLDDPPVREVPVDDHREEDRERGACRDGVGVPTQPPRGAVVRSDVVRRGLDVAGADAHRVASTGVVPRGRRRAARTPRVRSACARYSTMITIALNAGVADAGTPRNTTVLSKVAMRSAPIAAPISENRPP